MHQEKESARLYQGQNWTEPQHNIYTDCIPVL